MSRRNNLDRCLTCKMHETLWICALVPRLETRTRLALLLHLREVPKPTNTGSLAARCLPRSRLELVGDPERRAELPVSESHEQPLLLYPHADAVSIEAYANHERAVVLIVPDGS